MPLPQVVFTQDSSMEARSLALCQLEQGLDSVGISAVKTQVLRVLINFAKKNMVEAGPFDFKEQDFLSCNAIFNRANLPDLLFLQYVINRMSALRYDTSGLRKTVLQVAHNYQRPLLLPLVRQMEKATFSFSIAVLFMEGSNLNLPALADFFNLEATAATKLERMLNVRLLGLQSPAVCVNDSFEDIIDYIAGLADRAGRAALGFFNRESQASGAVSSMLVGPTRYQPRT